MADRLSRNRKFAGLIYVACQNDFMKERDWGQEAQDLIDKFRSISDRFSNNVIVFLNTYLEYNLRDIFVDEGWEDEDIEKTTQLCNTLTMVAKKSGIAFYDWTDIVDNYRKEQKTMLAPFVLYADHCHLSPLGNELMARKLFSMVTGRWVVADAES